MRFVIDSNVLFTYFWKNSFFRKISDRIDLVMLTPEFTFEELKKHEQYLQKKTKLTKEEFNRLKIEISNKIGIISPDKYSSSIPYVLEIIKEMPETVHDDIDFLALATKMQCFLWSDDKSLKKQDAIIVLNTAEMVKVLSNL